MPFNSPFMSLTFSRYVRFIFHVCHVLSLRVISLHLPSPIGFLVRFVSLSFPLHSPCFHFCPLHVPFSSPLFPFHFPLLSCHVDFLFPPLISLHFLAFPCCSPIFPATNTLFPAFSQLGRPKTQQRAGRGNRAWDPCLATPAPRRLRLVEGGAPAPHISDVGRGGGGVRGGVRGGVILYPLLGVRHAEQCRRIWTRTIFAVSGLSIFVTYDYPINMLFGLFLSRQGDTLLLGKPYVHVALRLSLANMPR